MVAGFLAGAILAGGVGTFAVQEIQEAIEASQPRAAAPVLDAEQIAQDLQFAHDGIRVDWEADPQIADGGLDEGHRVTRAPGVLMVDTLTLRGMGVGTGMVLSQDGLAVTNYHVVEDSSEVTVTVADTGRRYTAVVLGRDSRHDVAVLQLEDADGLTTVSIDEQIPRRGDLTAAVGNGGGQGYLTAVTGEVTGLDRSIMAGSEIPDDCSRLTGLIETEADVVPGYSGGPLVNDDGQVVGVTTAASRGETAREVDGYAIPITVALGVVDQVLSGEETETVSIGVDGALGIMVSTVDGAARIEEVTEGSAAEKLGLRAGDTVLRVDGEEVVSSKELADLVNDRNAGDTVTVEWRTSDGEPRQGQAVLQEAVVN
ncbi:S1C family serine protease [Micrococcus terreus]|uniref:S1C family serine protease n=1 Tax=Micrococcus terreus TaxID=574650 RepID=UPI0021A2D3F5|nr:S1C family serine protease [Micrococcus terreus]MCT2088104.1 S1C family serine protease [Micrococcus terreus]